MMKHITHDARCAIRIYSTNGNVSALWHDLRNGPVTVLEIIETAIQSFASM